MSATTAERERLAGAILPRALRYARKIGGNRFEEEAIDAATDAVLRALEAYEPDRGPWPAYAMGGVKLAVLRAVIDARRQQRAAYLDDQDPAARPVAYAGPAGMLPDLSDLPEAIRDAVRLYYVDRFTMAEVGMLLGVTNEAIRLRLNKAAAILGAGIDRPKRGKKAKRIRR